MIVRALDKIAFDSHCLWLSASVVLIQESHRSRRSSPIHLLSAILRLYHLLSLADVEVLDWTRPRHAIELGVVVLFVEVNIGVLLLSIRVFNFRRFHFIVGCVECPLQAIVAEGLWFL